MRLGHVLMELGKCLTARRREQPLNDTARTITVMVISARIGWFRPRNGASGATCAQLRAQHGAIESGEALREIANRPSVLVIGAFVVHAGVGSPSR